MEFRRGHFYGMTTHARGAIFLEPEHERCSTSAPCTPAPCASTRTAGARLSHDQPVRLGLGAVPRERRPLPGGHSRGGGLELSCGAELAEQVSSICAVLAETDVINMVSRGISTSNILKGIHQSMAGRYLKLAAGHRRRRARPHHRWSSCRHRSGQGDARAGGGGQDGPRDPHPPRFHLCGRTRRGPVGWLSPPRSGPALAHQRMTAKATPVAAIRSHP